jgi:cytoskeletal protein CcmA (bactofilin family)
MAGTIIESGLSVEGEITSEEEIVVHGEVRGKLATTDALSVGASGNVEADVSASTLAIAGRVTGDVAATERVDLQAGGRLLGDVKTARLTIADGATFKGNVDMDA